MCIMWKAEGVCEVLSGVVMALATPNLLPNHLLFDLTDCV